MINPSQPPISYTLIRSKRKTLSIQIKNGELIARAPMKLAKHEIERFIESKRGWIEDKLSISKERVAQRDSYKLSYGSLVPYRGVNYPIVARTGGQLGLDHDESHFLIPPDLDHSQIKEALIEVYKCLAKSYIPKKTLEIAETLGLKPSVIRITSAKTRWGSCSTKGSINFSYRLILAPDELIKYVIIHELCHLKEHNHGQNFWNLVESILPDYRSRRAKLIEFQRNLRGNDL